MKKHIISILFVLIAISSARLVSDVPLAVWSGSRIITGQNVGISNSLPYNEVESMLESFVHNGVVGELTKFVTGEKPEVVVLFIESKLRSEELTLHSSSFPTLKKLLQSETSSLYAPFIELSVSLQDTITNIAYHTKQNSGKTFYVGKGSTLLQDLKRRVPTITSLAYVDLESVLEQNSQIFTNGVVDLIVIYLDSKSSDKFISTDSTIARVQSFISSKTTNYVDVYTALSYDYPADLKMDFGKQRAKRYFLQTPTVDLGNASTNGTNGTTDLNTFRYYFGGWFWELFLVCLFLIPLLVIGVYAIDSIQTPLFDMKVKPKAKMN